MPHPFARTMFAAAAMLISAATPALAQTDWQRQIARIVASKQTYPRAAQMRGDEGTARVKVYVAADGSIEKTELVSPSGSTVLDREAVGLPARAGRFPAPPGGATAVVLPLTWKLL